MNVGGLSAVRKPVVRPRSPEPKASATRTRSPNVKQATEPRTTLRPAAAFSSSGAQSPPAVGSRSPQQHQFGGPKPGAHRTSTSGDPRSSVSSTLQEIKKIDMNREQRRRATEELRKTRQEEAELLGQQCGGRAPDIDFHRMIREFRSQCAEAVPTEPIDLNLNDKGIVVCVRKRPLQSHEVANRELDCVTALNPYAIIHERKFKVDGITKCLESHQFEFDRVFAEDENQEKVYSTVTAPLVPWVFNAGGRATLFAYGQTGSGKTYTMTGIQRQMAEHIFEELQRYSSSGNGPLNVSVSFFEIYGGRPFDLLNNRQRLETLEDSKNEVQIAGLVERAVASPAEMLSLIDLGNSLRTTHATAINRDSSRSHAVCHLFLRKQPNEVHGKWTLVDLAGSERAADSKSSIRQRRVEGAQINKSLLALKECIRAMGDPREAHIPFRASKLTLVLRDAFISKGPSKTVMIACISPGMFSADHSVNTLRYSDRLKDHPRGGGAGGSSVTHSRDARSPDSRGATRMRSPSPTSASIDAARQRLSAAVESVPKDALEGDYIDDEIASDEEPVEEEPPKPPAQVPEAWPQTSPSEPVRSAPQTASATESRAVGSRQPISRRGRQPTGRPREAMAPGRPDALGSRAEATASRSSTERPAQVPKVVLAQAAGANAADPEQSAEAVRSPRGRGQREASPKRGEGSGDLSLQDNRYLHNTLTTEVMQGSRNQSATGIVDVGVEDLTDLAHMEALDEVRQWEDRIVSQHMVALQEDARLLTVESELLSQVQQVAAYDIDWYVSEVDKVVRRKMEVYASFLDELEVFKAQLRREETLSRSCQKRPVGAGTGTSTTSAAPGASSVDTTAISPRALVRDGAQDGTPQQTPRTPRRA